MIATMIPDTMPAGVSFFLVVAYVTRAIVALIWVTCSFAKACMSMAWDVRNDLERGRVKW